jgi:hypothetical protein
LVILFHLEMWTGEFFFEIIEVLIRENRMEVLQVRPFKDLKRPLVKVTVRASNGLDCPAKEYRSPVSSE